MRRTRHRSDFVVEGTLLCGVRSQPGYILMPNEALAVRNPDGSTIWSVTPPAQNCPFTPALAPDAAHLAVEGTILGRDGTVTSAPPLVAPTGCRVIIPPTSLFLVKTSSPGASTRFPVAGTFVGVLPRA
jgi:hypothetical protein